MLLPYASDQTPTRRPALTLALLALNLVISGGLALHDHFAPLPLTATVTRTLGIVPGHFRLYTLLTYMFVHDGPAHMFANVFYLWVFGAGVEAAVSKTKYMLCYLGGGAVAGGLQSLVTVTLLPAAAGQTPIVGASAACAALAGLFAVRYYRARLSFVSLPFRPHVVYVIAVYIGLQIGLALWEVISGSSAAMVANWAHVGGFVFGLTAAYALRLDEKGKRAYLSSDAARSMERSVPGDAIGRWESLLAREPSNLPARAEIARAWMALGDTEQAATSFERAIDLNLASGKRRDAAALYSEMRKLNVRAASLGTGQLFLLGAVLEEAGEFSLAAETLQSAATRAPDSPAAEPSILRAAAIYLHQVNRADEARGILRDFHLRYPHSEFNALAQKLTEEADQFTQTT